MTTHAAVIANGVATTSNAPILAALITGGAALITGLIVATFAWRQWSVAKDKLALDLFDRRFAASNAFLDAATARMEEISTERDYSPLRFLSEPAPTVNRSAEFLRKVNDIRFLFGLDVWEASKKIAVNLAEQSKLHEAMMAETDMAGPGFKIYWASRMRFEDLVVEFRRTTHPYMMLGHVAVNRPSRRLRTPWTRKRPQS